jgi:hypothetical protein
MNRITRMLTMTGLGLVAGATLGAGPVMAVAGTGHGTAQSSSSAGGAQSTDRERVVGVYRTYRACAIAGRIGERFGRWDEWDCERRGWGFRSRWLLEVSWDHDWDDDDDDWDGPWIVGGGHHGGNWGGGNWGGGHHGGGHHGGGHHGGGHHGGGPR